MGVVFRWLWEIEGLEVKKQLLTPFIIFLPLAALNICRQFCIWFQILYTFKVHMQSSTIPAPFLFINAQLIKTVEGKRSFLYRRSSFLPPPYAFRCCVLRTELQTSEGGQFPPLLSSSHLFIPRNPPPRKSVLIPKPVCLHQLKVSKTQISWNSGPLWNKAG